MSVAGDGDNAGDSGGQSPIAGPLPPAAGSLPRHRVPPTAAAAARVLPEPFTPPKPTIPKIPHQRRPDGPTAVATASIPAASAASAVDEPDPSPVATLAGEARADAADLGDARNLEFIVTLPGISNDPELSTDLEVAEEPIETVEGELVSTGPMPPADDSPTVADYRAPALAIVTDYGNEDADDYRGSRRRMLPWRRFPVGALAVAVLILLVTGAVVFAAVRGDDSSGNRDDALPGRVPGVEMPGGPAPAAVAGSPSEEPTETATEAAEPVATRPRTVTTTTSVSHAPSAGPSTTSAAPPPPPVAQPNQGRLVGAQSHKCLEYRTGSSNRIFIDNCDTQTNQVWKVQGNATTGATLRSDNGLCLDVANAGTANGTAIQVYSCNGTVAQTWVRRADNTWQNPNSKRCLTAAGTGAGSYVVLYDCVAASAQVWAMQ